MRFLHTADIHLDSPLTGLSAYDDAPAALLRGATRAAFTQLVSHAIDEAVDFVVIAGDLYDGNWPDFNTGLYFCEQMGRLQRAHIPVFLLLGNHDAESQMTRALRLPDNVRRFSAQKAETFTLEVAGQRVALHGRSFKQRDTPDNLAATYPAPLPGAFNIGVLHTALEGHSAHATYAPCTLAELHAKGYDYWALGHVHDYALWTPPAPGLGATVCFPGNLQGRHIRETGPRGAVLVTLDELGAAPRVERVLLDVLRWEHLTLDVSGCDSLDAVGIQASRAFSQLLAQADERPRAVRLTLNGATALHGTLFAREQELRAHVLAEIAALGHERLWLEKVKLATRPPETRADPTLGADALAELAALLHQAGQEDSLREGLRADVSQLLGKAPELALTEPLLASLRDGELDALLADVIPGLLAQLGGESPSALGATGSTAVAHPAVQG